MRGHRAFQPPVERPGAPRVQRLRVDLERRVPLLEGQQPAPVPDDIGVGEPVGLDALCDGVGVHRVEGIEQAAPLAALQRPLHRARPAVPVPHAAVPDAEHVQHAVAGEPVVVAARRELRVGAVAVVGDVEIGRQLAAHDDVVDVALHADGREVPGELRVVGVGDGHGRASAGAANAGSAVYVNFGPGFERRGGQGCMSVLLESRLHAGSMLVLSDIRQRLLDPAVLARASIVAHRSISASNGSVSSSSMPPVSIRA